MKKKEQVQKMFNDISGRYDFLNHFLSLGIDFIWRRKFVSQLSSSGPDSVLDVATGTGDLAILIAQRKTEHVTGIDIAENMLAIAKEKSVQKQLQVKLTFAEGDAEDIPFPDETFDAVTVAFGVRNFENLDKGLSEMKRVLKPGGVMMILEFSHPVSFPWKQLYNFYSRFMIPFFGKIISGDEKAYTYLPESVAAFPSGKDFLDILERVGMKKSSERPLTFGIATIYAGEK
jgi:demethylmenaquinone methyltransferase / 2-methoxy-6-polyprenyl-1,4-benzoquinol methylase